MPKIIKFDVAVAVESYGAEVAHRHIFRGYPPDRLRHSKSLEFQSENGKFLFLTGGLGPHGHYSQDLRFSYEVLHKNGIHLFDYGDTLVKTPVGWSPRPTKILSLRNGALRRVLELAEEYAMNVEDCVHRFLESWPEFYRKWDDSVGMSRNSLQEMLNALSNEEHCLYISTWENGKPSDDDTRIQLGFPPSLDVRLRKIREIFSDPDDCRRVAREILTNKRTAWDIQYRINRLNQQYRFLRERIIGQPFVYVGRILGEVSPAEGDYYHCTFSDLSSRRDPNHQLQLILDKGGKYRATLGKLKLYELIAIGRIAEIDGKPAGRVHRLIKKRLLPSYLLN